MKTLKKIHLGSLEKRCLSEEEMILLKGGKYYGDGTGSCGCGCLGPSSTEDNAAANSVYLLDSPGNWKGSVTGGGPGICYHMVWDSTSAKYVSDDCGSRG